MSPLKEGLGLEDPAAAGGVGGAAGLAPAGLKKKKEGLEVREVLLLALSK